MKLKLGDRVKFLNESGGGIVIEFIDKQTVMVQTPENWDMPMLISELIQIETDDMSQYGKHLPKEEPKKQKQAHKSKPQETQQPKQTTTSTSTPTITTDILDQSLEHEKLTNDINIFYAFVPQNQHNVQDSNIEAYLINDSNFHIYYTILVPITGNIYKLKQHGRLEANTKLQIETIKHEALNDLSKLIFQFVFFKQSNFEPKAPQECAIKISPVKFFKQKSYKENDFFDRDAIVIPIIEQDSLAEAIKQISPHEIEQAILDKKKSEQVKDKALEWKQKMDNIETERIIDLHIHELVEDYSLMTPKEMIDLQLHTFRSEMKNAMQDKHLQRIVFIHGVGNGTLKLELRRELEREYKKYEFQDASFREYGFGATMVHLRKK